jgi:hypothetical protein
VDKRNIGIMNGKVGGWSELTGSKAKVTGPPIF